VKTRLTLLSTLTVLAILAGALPAAAADSPLHLTLRDILAREDVVIPEAWSGIFDVDSETRDCDTNELLFADSYQDTICTGDVIDFGDDEVTFTCTGGFDGNTLAMTCTASTEVIPGCTANFDLSFDATLSGDVITSVNIMSITYEGAACGPIPDTCQRTEETSTRIAPEPEDCPSTATATTDWGTIKSLYR